MAGGKRGEQAHPSNGCDRPNSRYDRVQAEETDRINIEIGNINKEQELQHPSPNGNARGQEEESDNMQNSKCSNLRNFFIAYWCYIVTAVVILFGTGVGTGVLATGFFRASPINKTTSNPDDCKLLLAASEPGRRPCPTDWIGFQTKCFYFSNKEETWSASRDFCSLNNASLPVIDDKEMDFVQRYKGSIPYWIGLQREPEQPWTWVNGSVSTLEVLGDGGNCAYLNDEGRPSSSRCSTFHQWICSKPDEFTRPKRV